MYVRSGSKNITYRTSQYNIGNSVQACILTLAIYARLFTITNNMRK